MQMRVPVWFWLGFCICVCTPARVGAQTPVGVEAIRWGLPSAGYDPGGADGLFGPRTRAAIRNWRSSRGAPSTGYPDGAQVEASPRHGASSSPALAGAAAAQAGGAEVVFWQSIQNSTNPAEFEAYLEQFPDGVFRGLAQARLAALRAAAAREESPASAAATSAAEARGGEEPPRDEEERMDCLFDRGYPWIVRYPDGPAMCIGRVFCLDGNGDIVHYAAACPANPPLPDGTLNSCRGATLCLYEEDAGIEITTDVRIRTILDGR